MPLYCKRYKVLNTQKGKIKYWTTEIASSLFDSWVWKVRWRRDRLPTAVFLSFPCGSVGKESTCNVGDLGLIPGLGRSPAEGNSYPLQYLGLEKSMDCIVYGLAKSCTRLSGFHFHFLSLKWNKSMRTFILPLNLHLWNVLISSRLF